MSVEVKCQTCGKTFETWPAKIKIGKGKFCSRKCNSIFQTKREKKICEICGKEFEIIPSKLKKGWGRFCSKKCKGIAQRNRIIKKCKNCGKEFTTTPGYIKRNEGQFCSLNCSGEYNRGSNHYAWLGGISFEPYCSKFNNEFKERVREFWDRKCGFCGKTEEENLKEFNEKLAVHHVNYEKMVCCNNVAPLFITGCKKCHVKTNFNRDYWEEMLTNYIMIWFNGESYLKKS